MLDSQVRNEDAVRPRPIEPPASDVVRRDGNPVAGLADGARTGLRGIVDAARAGLEGAGRAARSGLDAAGEAIEPVLRDVADSVGRTAREGAGAAVAAAQVDEAVGRLNSDGDTAHLRVAGVLSGSMPQWPVTAVGSYGANLSIAQNGDGPDASFTVRTETQALGALAASTTLGDRARLGGDLSLQTTDTAEMTFATREDATRAAKLVQRLAMADAAAQAATTMLPGLGAASSAVGGGSNPLANPLTGPGAPSVLAQEIAGIGAEDRAFLQGHITAYEQTAAIGAGGALEGALPFNLPTGVAEAFTSFAAEGKATGRTTITRRVEMPSDDAPGRLTYTMGGEVALSAKEKALIGDVAPKSAKVETGIAVQNRLDLGRARTEVSAHYDLPAGDATRSLGGTAVPEAGLIAAGEMGRPDSVSAKLSYEYRTQGPLDVTRGDSRRGSIGFDDIRDPDGALGALAQAGRGDWDAAARALDADFVVESETVARTGVNVQIGPKLVVGPAKLEAGLILEAGVDDVTPLGTAEVAPAPEPAGPTAVVTPRDGLTLRDAPGGERTSVFQAGTFLQPTGESVLDAEGEAWIPVRGTDLNDDPVQGWVAGRHLRPHDGAEGAMDATGRTNPSLEAQGYTEIQARDGDNLWDLARRHGVPFEAMVGLNDEHLIHPNLIFEGDTVYVPGTAGAVAPAGPAPEPIADATTGPSGSGGTSGPLAGSDGAARTGASGSGSSGASSGEGSTSAPAGGESRDAPTTSTPPVAGDRPRGDGTASGSADAGADDSVSSRGAAGPAPVDTGETSAPPAEAAGRPDLAHVLDEYQVPEEERTLWGPRVAGVDVLSLLGRGDERIDLPVTEAGLLDELGPLDIRRWAGITRGIEDHALERFAPPEGHPVDGAHWSWSNDGHADAYRHAAWNAEMTRAFGEDWTAAYATAHEMLPGNPAAREAMDLYNNEQGRRIAAENPDASPAELRELVAQAMADGELVVLDRDGQLAWSDAVAYGEHGNADPDVTLPADPGHRDRNLARDGGRS